MHLLALFHQVIDQPVPVESRFDQGRDERGDRYTKELAVCPQTPAGAA
jgi:hypothetical protein